MQQSNSGIKVGSVKQLRRALPGVGGQHNVQIGESFPLWLDMGIQVGDGCIIDLTDPGTLSFILPAGYTNRKRPTNPGGNYRRAADQRAGVSSVTWPSVRQSRPGSTS